MKKILFILFMVSTLYAQNIHESEDFYLSYDEGYYKTKLNGIDFYVLDSEEARILDNHECEYFDVSYVLNALNNKEKEILKDYTYILVHSKKFELHRVNRKVGNYIANGFIKLEPENIIFVANSKTKWFKLTEKERILIHEMAHALTAYKYGGTNHDEYWALEVKRIVRCLVSEEEVDQYVKNMLKDYGLRGTF